MSYTKQNFVSGQILKAEHMNHIEDGIGQLTEEIIFSYDPSSGKYSCSHSFTEIGASINPLNAKYYDNSSIAGEAGYGYARALYVRFGMNMSTFEQYYTFTFLNSDFSGYITFKITNNGTVTQSTI